MSKLDNVHVRQCLSWKFSTLPELRQCLHCPNSDNVCVTLTETMCKSDNVWVDNCPCDPNLDNVCITLTWTMSKLYNSQVVWVTLTWTMSMLTESPKLRQCLSCKLSAFPKLGLCLYYPNSDNVRVANCPHYQLIQGPSQTMSELGQCRHCSSCPSYCQKIVCITLMWTMSK